MAVYVRDRKPRKTVHQCLRQVLRVTAVNNLSKICRRREANNLWKSLPAAQTVHAPALAMQISDSYVSRQGRGREVGIGVLGEVLAYADSVKAHQVEGLRDYLQATKQPHPCALR